MSQLYELFWHLDVTCSFFDLVQCGAASNAAWFAVIFVDSFMVFKLLFDEVQTLPFQLEWY